MRINPFTGRIIRGITKKIEPLKILKGFAILPVLIHVNGLAKDLTNTDFLLTRSISAKS